MGSSLKRRVGLGPWEEADPSPTDGPQGGTRRGTVGTYRPVPSSRYQVEGGTRHVPVPSSIPARNLQTSLAPMTHCGRGVLGRSRTGYRSHGPQGGTPSTHSPRHQDTRGASRWKLFETLPTSANRRSPTVPLRVHPGHDASGPSTPRPPGTLAVRSLLGWGSETGVLRLRERMPPDVCRSGICQSVCRPYLDLAPPHSLP